MQKNFNQLAGISIDSLTSCNGVSFRENLLFTHRGLSGPAMLQASLDWNQGDALEMDLDPDQSSEEWLFQQKREGTRMEMKNVLATRFPERFAKLFTELYFSHPDVPLRDIPDQAIKSFAKKLKNWRVIPASTVGFQKAEVTRGGVSTDELSSKTMECKNVPGLYFIGEVIDVTGWLGGYNFQWAWSSGWAAGQVV
jgi:predicted Rossmann fold flavoprotein